MLLASGVSVSIASVKVGDEVLATDPQTGLTGARSVTRLIRHSGAHTMVDVAFADGTTITATDHHPFWDATRHTFTYAIDLPVGDQVLEADGQILTITHTHVFTQDLTAYNLQIDGIHTHDAGTTPVLVDNACGRATARGCSSSTKVPGDDRAIHLIPGSP